MVKLSGKKKAKKTTKPLFKTKKSTNALTNNEDKVYSNSIYYDTKNFEKVSKHIIHSKLLNQSTFTDTTNNTNTNSINNKLDINSNQDNTNKLDNTNLDNTKKDKNTKKYNNTKKDKNKHIKKMVALSITKSNVNGKKTEKTSILIKNGKTIKKIKRLIKS
jgi:hypothetical protein